MRAALLIAAALGLAAAPALATDIVIEDYVGRITVVSGAPGIDVLHSYSKLTTAEGETLLVDGGIRKPHKTKVCDGGAGGFTLSINGRDRIGGDKRAAKRLADYGDIRISVPDGSTLKVKNSYVWLDTSAVTLSRADLATPGCLPVRLGDVLDAKIKASGSTNITAARIGTLKMSKSGSGDLTADEIGTFSLSQSGSGEVEVERIGVSADIRKSGAGDIEFGTVEGPLSLTQSGSGDLDVDGGNIPTLSINKSGSGNVDIGATVGDANVQGSGSGDMRIGRVTGELEKRTSGSVNVSVDQRD